VIEALQTSSAIRSVMADLVAGVQPYRTLRRRLLSTFEVRLATRALIVRLKPDTTFSAGPAKAGRHVQRPT